MLLCLHFSSWINSVPTTHSLSFEVLNKISNIIASLAEKRIILSETSYNKHLQSLAYDPSIKSCIRDLREKYTKEKQKLDEKYI